MEWDTGIFQCFGEHCHSFIVSVFCPVCQLAYQRAGLDQRECGFTDFIITLFCPVCVAVYTRTSIREKYNIDGSISVDVLYMLLCTVCAIAQQTRQMDLRGAKPAGMWMG
eukprot:TRINITY_DN15144_c0_g1_i1.p1 TRINITY_DN15144_c0_g1~~TRINITY_DN15144_c0_g1_i1.p1  ORF type:complete len:110 (+),score=23.34 TRINITY_DN15144_c0_g1_i1:186-515(+)